MFSFNRYYSYCYNHCNCYNQSHVIQRTLSLNFDVPVTKVQFGAQTWSYIPLCSFWSRDKTSTVLMWKPRHTSFTFWRHYYTVTGFPISHLTLHVWRGRSRDQLLWHFSRTTTVQKLQQFFILSLTVFNCPSFILQIFPKTNHLFKVAKFSWPILL